MELMVVAVADALVGEEDELVTKGEVDVGVISVVVEDEAIVLELVIDVMEVSEIMEDATLSSDSWSSTGTTVFIAVAIGEFNAAVAGTDIPVGVTRAFGI